MSYKLSFFRMAGEQIEVVDKWLRNKVASIKEVAYSGSYNDLEDTPTIPAAANDGTLTIKRNSVDVATFTANQATNTTADISVPTSYNDLDDLPDLTLKQNVTDASLQTTSQTVVGAINEVNVTLNAAISNVIVTTSSGYSFTATAEGNISIYIRSAAGAHISVSKNSSPIWEGFLDSDGSYGSMSPLFYVANGDTLEYTVDTGTVYDGHFKVYA